jgi:GT2 family glycosyltransferase
MDKMAVEYPVSVVVVTKNRSHLLKQCLEAIKNQTISDLQLVVIDDNSTDETQIVAKKFSEEFTTSSDDQKMIYLKTTPPAIGLTNGRNLGIRSSMSEIIIFADDDAIPNNDWVEKIKDVFDTDERIGGVRGRVIPITNHFVNTELADFYTISDQVEDTEFLQGCNMAVRKSAVLQSGMFTPGIMHYEEQELSARLRSNGFRIVYTPYAIVKHDYANGTLHFLKKKLRAGKWLRHLSKGDSFKHFQPKRRRFPFQFVIIVTIAFFISSLLSIYHDIFSMIALLLLSLDMLIFIAMTMYYNQRKKHSLKASLVLTLGNLFREIAWLI